ASEETSEVQGKGTRANSPEPASTGSEPTLVSGRLRADSTRQYGRTDMKILVLGGDGFCGWPTSLHLSAEGHDVAIVDNLSRRNIDTELESGSLTPICPMGERLRAWKELTGKNIAFHNFNVAVNYQRLVDLLESW